MNNKYQLLFNQQSEHFNTDATKPLAWRLEQLARMEKMLTENRDRFCAALYDDFRKPTFEQQNSGIGKYYGKAGFDALSNRKGMLIGNPDRPLDIFPPYAEKDLSASLSLFVED